MISNFSSKCVFQIILPPTMRVLICYTFTSTCYCLYFCQSTRWKMVSSCFNLYLLITKARHISCSLPFLSNEFLFISLNNFSIGLFCSFVETLKNVLSFILVVSTFFLSAIYFSKFDYGAFTTILQFLCSQVWQSFPLWLLPLVSCLERSFPSQELKYVLIFF